MPRKALSEEEKAARQAKRETPEGIRDQLDKLKEKEAKLLADLAIKEHPALETTITSVSGIVRDAQKATKAMTLGIESSVERKREAFQKKIEMYENKIAAIRESISNLSGDSVKGQLEENRATAMVNLKRILVASEDQFAAAGVTAEMLVPAVGNFLDELATVEVPAEAEAVEA